MSGPQILIHRATKKDADIVAKLLHALLNELAKGNGPSFSELRATATHLLDEQLVLGVIARIEDDPGGILMLNECAAVYAGGRFGEITELYVKPEHRSRGIAATLLAEAKEIARQRNWRRLEVGAPDQPAWNRTLGFYLREGFEEVGPRLRLPL